MRVRKETKEMHMATRFDRTVRVLVAGALAISALAGSPALAKGTSGGTTTPKCVVTPNPVTGGVAYIVVSGSGFTPGMVVNLYIKDKISTWIVYGGNVPGGTVAFDGTFSIANIASSVFYPSDLGTKTVSVTNAANRRQATLAQCSFSVQ